MPSRKKQAEALYKKQDDQRNQFQKWKKKSVAYIFISVVLLAFVAMPTLIVLVVGLFPSVVAGLVDKSMTRMFGWCVTSCNIAGVFPSLFYLWTNTNSIDLAFQIVVNPYRLIAMYICASVGWVLFFTIPYIARYIVVIFAKKRVVSLESKRKELRDLWGEGVGDKFKKIKKLEEEEDRRYNN